MVFVPVFVIFGDCTQTDDGKHSLLSLEKLLTLYIYCSSIGLGGHHWKLWPSQMVMSRYVILLVTELLIT